MPETQIATSMTTEEIEAFRTSLQDKRAQLIDLYKHDVRVGQESSDDSADDSVDRANNSFNRELMFALSDTERSMLILVDDAMQRIEQGGFGSCTHCEGSIGMARLEAVPWARYCIDCQEREETGDLQG